MYIAIGGNMCYRAITKAGLTYMLPHGAELIIEQVEDSLVASVCCNVWVNKKVFMQSYSTEWTHEDIRSDIATRVFNKFNMVVYKGVEI